MMPSRIRRRFYKMQLVTFTIVTYRSISEVDKRKDKVLNL